ncbi:hypothetical protein AB0D11_21330 [Streptomyces monashensis]|uniref:hypothetical protein n=1 Tax=Streptomyces monashensis TaxID=1678012 RepID=UPI0033C3489E
MTVSIIHRFLRWVLGVFAPGTGSRRAGAYPTASTFAHNPETPWTSSAWPPASRSPYGLDTALDGHASRLVRPYVLEAERERERARQHRRRVALVLAADFGIDLDRHLIGAEGVPA